MSQAVNGCPKQEALLRYARGESNAAEAGEVEAHINEDSGCVSCAEIVSTHDETEDPEDRDEDEDRTLSRA